MMTVSQSDRRDQSLKLRPRLVPRRVVATGVVTTDGGRAFWLRGQAPRDVCLWLCQQANRVGSTLASWDLYRLAEEDCWIAIANAETELASEALGNRGISLYRPIAGLEVWIPISAALQPASSSLSSLWSDSTSLRAGHRLVWLPHRTPVILEPRNRVDVCEWIQTPSLQLDSWAPPSEAPPLVRRIASLRIERPATLREFVDDRDDPEASKLDWKEILSDEPSGVSTKLRQWMLKKADSWAEKHSTSSGRESSSRGAQSTSGKSMDRLMKSLMSSSIASQRKKAMEKWFKLAASDPARATRMALPLTGGSTGFRGVALPGAKLLERMMTFDSLGKGSGSGGALDLWGLDPSMSHRLIETYREMAQDAMASGAYKRAAYIYAELIGDYLSAAGSLAAGRHFHLAALMYRDKLYNRKRAAQCFASAGMIEDAISLHQSGNHFLDIADLYHQMGDAANEVKWIEREVERCMENHQIVTASDLISDRLNDQDRAADLLRTQWPGGQQVVPCGQKLLELWTYEHEKIIQWLEAANIQVNDESPSHMVMSMAEILNSAMAPNQHPLVRSIAHDSIAVLMANHHGRLSKKSVQRLANLVRNRAPQDRVLRRNVHSFQRSLGPELTRDQDQDASVDRSRPSSIRCVGRYQLPQATYLDALSVNGEILLLAVSDDQLLASRWTVSDSVAHSSPSSSKLRVVTRKSKVWADTRLTVDRGEDLHSLSAEIVPINSDRSSRSFAIRKRSTSEAEKPVSIDRCVLYGESEPAVPWRFEDAIPKALNAASSVINHPEFGWVGLLQRETGYEFARVSVDGTLRTRMVPELLEQSDCASLLALAEHVVATAGRHVVFGVQKPSRQREIEVDGPVVRLAGSSPKTRKRIAVCHQNGLDLLWPTVEGIDQSHIERDQLFMDAVWLAGGRLFAISESHVHKYLVNGQKIIAVGTKRLAEKPLRILATGSDGCCVVYTQGTVEQFA